ncbi:hypothetical protein F511_39335 [Dorcoceras hygrometricum]|uniref:Uncharacterized protein n=1 Tax=Dorcoceras hygrometricum TaxID=472368 RepID=A0A2Z7CPE9_9LAMI|nr:hypothetical protein F511_39335 [Dorcoceras hygrometricum]
MAAHDGGTGRRKAAAGGVSIGYPRMKASGESSTTKHRLLHTSGPHPIPPPNDPKKVPLEEFDAHSFCLHPVTEPRSR